MLHMDTPGYITCSNCGNKLLSDTFLNSNNKLFLYRKVPICNTCLKQYIRDNLKFETRGDWTLINKLCQWIDLPFVADKWIKTVEASATPEDAFITYARIFEKSEYPETVDWLLYNQKYLELKARNQLEDTVEIFNEDRRNQLIQRWGPTYDDQELNDLENLFEGMKRTQNVVGTLAVDDAKKLCKISLEIDRALRDGSPIDKLISSYDKMKATAGFTTNTTQNMGDFESMGEIVAYLEKTGWVNPYYQGAAQDIVDETMQNFCKFVQRLYTNESNLGDMITERVQAIKSLQSADTIFEQPTLDLDEYERKLLEEVSSDQVFEEEV